MGISAGLVSGALALALVVVFIDRVEITVLTLAVAIGAAVIGSYSSLQGLLVWPIGMMLILYRGRSRRHPGRLGRRRMYRNDSSLLLPLEHQGRNRICRVPSLTTRYPTLFSIFAVGDVLGVPIRPGGSNAGIFLFGLVIVVLALATLGLCGLRSRTRRVRALSGQR